MQGKRAHGLWSQEIAALKPIEQQMSAYQADISAKSGPALGVQHKQTIAQIEEKLRTAKSVSFFNSRLPQLKTNLNELVIFKENELIAEKTALKLVLKYSKMLKKLVDSYESMSFYEHLSVRSFSVKLTRSLSLRVWTGAQNKLNHFKKIQDFSKRQHNSLAHLLLTDNQTFLESVMQDRFSIEGEIGFLVIQRLQTIYYNTQSSSRIRGQAGKKIRQLMTSKTPDSLLCYDENILFHEIRKLALHAQCHPENKVVWLGTARAVNAMIKQVRPTCIYLNPPPKDLTWTINRFWLQAAMHLGYRFRLVEQHFPEVEAAILSQDSNKFLEQLLLETRADDADKTSQYNGNYSPTATTQEILALMDMGCVAYKNPQDHSISFYPPTISYEEPLSYRHSQSNIKEIESTNRCIKRTHSYSEGYASEPPPYEDRTDHFNNWASRTL